MRAATLFTLALLGCSTFKGPVRTDQPMDQAVREAAVRLEASGITIKPFTVTARSLKTDWHCLSYRGERQGGVDWDTTWANIANGPLPFETVGAANAKPDPGDRCPVLFRVEIEAHTEGEQTRLDAHAAWYRATAGQCQPEGDPLEGLARCQWTYQATHRTEPATRRVYYALRDL